LVNVRSHHGGHASTQTPAGPEEKSSQKYRFGQHALWILDLNEASN